jgi:REP element-mobilizing transposase RayT
MTHDLRPPHDGRHPIQVTLRAAIGVPSLRNPAVFAAIERAISGSNRSRFRVLHFSVQQDHAHFIVEGDRHRELHSGIHGLAIRLALAINRATRRRGRLWGDRYHLRALTTPKEVRASMAYVLLNFREHLRAPPGVDPFSSGPQFSGWQRPPTAHPGAAPMAQPSTWLGRIGWLRAGGPLRFDEGPVRSPSRSSARRSR